MALQSEAKNTIAKSAKISTDRIRMVPHGTGILAVIGGDFGGHSLSYARQRRARAELAAKKLSEHTNKIISVHFEANDAIARATDALQAALDIYTNDHLSFSSIIFDRHGNCAVEILSGKALRKSQITRLEQSLEKSFSSILKGGNGHVRSLRILVSDDDDMANTQVDFAVLRTLKQIQPNDARTVQAKLSSSKFKDVDIDAVKRSIDRLRRRKLLAHVGNTNHCLTAFGLRLVPAYPGDNSPDINRVLRLGRRFRYNQNNGGGAVSRRG